MEAAFAKVGIYYHPVLPAARALAVELAATLAHRVPQVWVSSAWDPDLSTRDLQGTDLLICIGGDGTVLRGARAVVPNPTRILGIDMGRHAFLTELGPEELRERLPDLLAGNHRIEERSMLAVRCAGVTAGRAPDSAVALNDVIVGRNSLGRPVYVNVRVDGELIGLLRADAVVVATATGSTGYSLSAGGPILDPLSRSLVLTPVAPHLAAAAPLVLPPDAVIELSPGSDESVGVSVDGQDQSSLGPRDAVTVRRSEFVARLVRFGEKPFSAQLSRRLTWLDERRLKAVRPSRLGQGGADESLLEEPHGS